MAQKTGILLYNEAKGATINAANYFLQQGMPAYQLHQIYESLMLDLEKLMEQEMTQAQADYDAAVAAESQPDMGDTEVETAIEE
jgi:hypothetical protein